MPHTTDLLPKKFVAPYEGRETAVVTMLLCGDQVKYAGSGAFGDTQDTVPEDRLFEIGSISKVFTALLLAVLVEEGKIDPNRPLKELDPALSDVPDWITPQALATHTSGLPRVHVPMWKLLISPLPSDPYAAFSRADMLDWLRVNKGARQPRRARYSYSNLGFGLLGEAMAMHQHTPFLDLLREKVLTPMGLTDTAAELTPQQQARLMQPHTAKGQPVVPWTFQAIAGAGCLRSTARDMGRFASEVLRALDAPETTLDRAICNSVAPIFGLGRRGATEPMAQCLGWLTIKLSPDAPKMLFHNGGTAGSSCALYICPKASSAALILSNRGVAANLLSSLKLGRSNPHGVMSTLFAGMSEGRLHQNP